MARNRILHNVQDVFVGSTPDEADNLITGVDGHQILKRLNKVQSFNYSIELPQEDSSILGKSNPFSRTVSEPPTVNLTLSYLLNGVDNERKIGLNTGDSQCAVHDILTAHDKDSRNLYLTINSNNLDIRQKESFPSPFELSESKIGDSSAKDYSTIVFQNCYFNSYDLDVSPASFPSVSVGYIADSMLGYGSGSGINIPTLNAEDGSVTTNGKEFIIPKHFKEDANYTGDFVKGYISTNISISKVGAGGVSSFLNDSINQCSLNFSINRENISYLGHKLISKRLPKPSMKATLSFNSLVTGDVSGSFLDNAKENEDYNVVVDFKDESGDLLAQYNFSGAKLDSVNYSSALTNKSASFKFSNFMDLEDNAEGLFLNGKVTSAISGSETIYPQY